MCIAGWLHMLLDCGQSAVVCGTCDHVPDGQFKNMDASRSIELDLVLNEVSCGCKGICVAKDQQCIQGV